MGRRAGTPQSLEDAFWPRVWRCTHRAPCKKCCWPWKAKGIDLTVNWKTTWHEHATFSHPTLGPRCVPAHRVSYELTHGVLLLRMRRLHLCHRCCFGPCCNPWHVVPGAAADNARDARVAQRCNRIVLPNGECWVYAEACARQKAFYEAWFYKRVWAGPVPVSFQAMERLLYMRERYGQPKL
jgi:hypothetical protein